MVSLILSAQHSHSPAAPLHWASPRPISWLCCRSHSGEQPGLHFLALPFLLPDSSPANLDEGVDFDPPALGQGLNLHLADGAHVEMVHSRATPKPGHREREGNGELQQSGNSSQPCIPHTGIFILPQTLGREVHLQLRAQSCLYSTTLLLFWLSSCCPFGTGTDTAHPGLDQDTLQILGERMEWPYSPVVEIFPHVLGQNHNQVINVMVFIRRDPCGGKASGRVNQGSHYCCVQQTQLKKADFPF